MRPIYENSETLACEVDAAEFITKKFAVTLNKMPISYNIDWLACRGGRAVATIEYKRRKASVNQYPTLVLSLKKWNAGLDFVQKNNIAFMVFAEWDDAYSWLCVKPEWAIHTPNFYSEWRIGYGGRTKNTRDSADIEPVIYLPMNTFTTQKKEKKKQ